MNELMINIKEIKEINKFIIITIIGVLDALYEKCITINESEMYIFSPYSVDKIKKMGVDEQIINIVELGCELEDFKSLLPDRLNDKIKDLRFMALNILNDMPPANRKIRKWIS